MKVRLRRLPWLTYMLAAVVFLMLIAATGQAQTPAGSDPPEWPGFSDPRLNSFVHDEMHAVTSVAVAEGLGLFTDWPSETRYLASTIVMPAAQEIFDYIYWHKVEGHEFSLKHAMDDVVTYQSAWTVHFVKEKKWWQAAVSFVLPTVFTYARSFE